jgi:hypothetical protein
MIFIVVQLTIEFTLKVVGLGISIHLYNDLFYGLKITTFTIMAFSQAQDQNPIIHFKA